MLQKRTIRGRRRNGAIAPFQRAWSSLVTTGILLPWALAVTAAPEALAFTFEGSTLVLRQAHSGAGGLPETREWFWPEEHHPTLAALLRAYLQAGTSLSPQGFLSHHVAVTEQGTLRIAPNCDGSLKRPCLEAFTLREETARALLRALEDRSQESP
jgi:hypothetical protein